jgi:hypothetical protein
MYDVPPICPQPLQVILHAKKYKYSKSLCMHTHLQQNLLYLYPFVYNFPDDVLLEAETCRKGIINDK